MGLGPIPYDVREVVHSEETTAEGYHIYSEICDLHGEDELYGVIVVASSNSIIDKIKRLLSPVSKPPVPEDMIIIQKDEITRDGEIEAMEVKNKLVDEVKDELTARVKRWQ